MHGTRVADRETLISELQQFARDRAQIRNDARAADASQAAERLAEGAELVFFEQIYYVVGDTPARWTVVPVSRTHAVAELRDAARGWAHNGKPRLASEALRAAEEVSGGADYARVGHIVYEIVDNS